MYIALIISPDAESITGYGTFKDHKEAEAFAIKECANMNEDNNGWRWWVLWLNPVEHFPINIQEVNQNAEVLN